MLTPLPSRLRTLVEGLIQDNLGVRASGRLLRRSQGQAGCAFGGPDLKDLYITTGIHKTAKEEHAGRLFVIRGLGVRGVPAHAFAG